MPDQKTEQEYVAASRAVGEANQRLRRAQIEMARVEPPNGVTDVVGFNNWLRDVFAGTREAVVDLTPFQLELARQAGYQPSVETPFGNLLIVAKGE